MYCRPKVWIHPPLLVPPFLFTQSPSLIYSTGFKDDNCIIYKSWEQRLLSITLTISSRCNNNTYCRALYTSLASYVQKTYHHKWSLLVSFPKRWSRRGGLGWLRSLDWDGRVHSHTERVHTGDSQTPDTAGGRIPCEDTRSRQSQTQIHLPVHHKSASYCRLPLILTASAVLIL